jgi:peptidase propeptide and YPEB domain protein
MNPILFAGSIIAATFAFASAPALAGDDDAYYARHRKQFITHERAAQIARQAVKGRCVTSVEFDHEARDDHFDVDVRTADGREYDVKIDARSGKVRYVKRDD